MENIVILKEFSKYLFEIDRGIGMWAYINKDSNKRRRWRWSSSSIYCLFYVMYCDKKFVYSIVLNFYYIFMLWVFLVLIFRWIMIFRELSISVSCYGEIRIWIFGLNGDCVLFIFIENIFVVSRYYLFGIV